MDSYRYRNLLPPHDRAVWQQVDLDNNNAAGGGTSVQAGCDQGCQRTFVLEASTVDSTTARNTANYRQIDRVAPFDDSDRIRLGK